MITLKKIQVARSLSQETTAYTCDVYWKGKLIAHARNDGGGGMTWLQEAGSPGDYADASKFAQTQVFVVEGRNLMHTLDDLVDVMVEEHDEKKKLKASLRRQLAKSTRVLVGTDVLIYSRPYVPSLLSQLQAKHPEGKVLNACSLDEAVGAVWAVINGEVKGAEQ